MGGYYMNINQLSKEVASFIKNTNEFKAMNKSKLELDKNRNLKRQFDMYINKKNNLYSNYSLEDASKKVNQLNRDYNDFFNLPVVSNYIQKISYRFKPDTCRRSVRSSMKKNPLLFLVIFNICNHSMVFTILQIY